MSKFAGDESSLNPLDYTQLKCVCEVYELFVLEHEETITRIWCTFNTDDSIMGLYNHKKNLTKE